MTIKGENMKKNKIRDIIERLRSGEIDITEAEKLVELFYFGDLGFANVDHYRSTRQGFPEVIFGQNKTTGQIIKIAGEILRHENMLLLPSFSYYWQSIAGAFYSIIPRCHYQTAKQNRFL